jgi:HTH-type transcriptional regulator/antitoxin HigA
MHTIKNEYQPKSVTHPGLALREKLEEIKMSPKDFAIRCHKPIKTISEIMNGKSSITPDAAVQFEKVLKIPARFWLKWQSSYDEAEARHKQEQQIEMAKEWARTFPYAEMAKKGWIDPTQKVEEKVANLFDYFAISSHEAWHSVYMEKKMVASFRISLVHANRPHALSAWLRRGDLQAQELEAVPFDAKLLKAALPALKKIMATHPTDFFTQIQQVCLKTGLKIVYTPCLPGAPTNGVARWIDNNTTPLIQLSCRQKRNDIFWFSFFHEIGHILLHGKKDIFLEDVKYDEFDAVKEKEADDFAIKWTFSEKEEVEVMQRFRLTVEEIISFAEKFGTHPAMIIGRLQKKKFIRYSVGHDLIEKINLD